MSFLTKNNPAVMLATVSKAHSRTAHLPTRKSVIPSFRDSCGAFLLLIVDLTSSQMFVRNVNVLMDMHEKLRSRYNRG